MANVQKKTTTWKIGIATSYEFDADPHGDDTDQIRTYKTAIDKVAERGV